MEVPIPAFLFFFLYKLKNRNWAKERLVRFLVININRTLNEALEGYTYIDQFNTIPAFNKFFLKFVGKVNTTQHKTASHKHNTTTQQD